MKISNLPKASKPNNSDLITIVQGNATKSISVKDFTNSLVKNATKLASEIKALRAEVVKRSLNKENPTLAKNLKIPNPKGPNDAATKNYVDNSTAHRVKVDGSSKISAPLTYSGKFSFSAKDLVTKEYADQLLDATLKTVKNLNGSSYPKASAGDMFIAIQEYKTFATNGPDIQMGDILICLSKSEGGTHGEAGSQFAIINTNVVLATEDEAGILKIATDDEVRNFSSDVTALTPKKFKDSLEESSMYNRTLIDRATYTVLEEDRGILAVDNRRSSCIITLPTVSSLSNPHMFKIVIKDEFGQADLKNITIKASGATIDSKTQMVLSNKYQAVTIYNDGKNYYIENNTHAPDEISDKVIQAGLVIPSATGVETMYQSDIDLSQFDIGQGFVMEVSGFFAANGNTKTVILDIDGNTTVTNATTTAPNNDHFTARVTVIKANKYAVAYGYMLLEGIAADTYSSYTIDLDWNSTINTKVTANAASANTDIHIYSMILEPLK